MMDLQCERCLNGFLSDGIENSILGSVESINGQSQLCNWENKHMISLF